MGKDGKLVVKGSGYVPIEDGGDGVVFDSGGESCCCDGTSPTHCEPIRWNVIAPEGSLNISNMNYEMPTCLTLQLSGGAFAGTYEISAIGQGSGVLGGDGRFGERRSLIAQESFKAVNVPENLPFNGEKSVAVYAGWEYPVEFSFNLDDDGTLTGSIYVECSNRVVNIGGEYAGFVVEYEGVNFFNQPTVGIKTLYPLDSQYYGWDVFIDYTYKPRSVESGSSNGCSCEWAHRREIDMPIRTSQWYKKIISSPDTLFALIVDAPMEATPFDDVAGWNLETGGGEFSAWEYPTNGVYGRYANVVAHRRTPFEYGDSFSWTATLATPSFVRTTNVAADDVVAGTINSGGAYDIVSAFIPDDPTLPFGNGAQRLRIYRRFEVSRTFGGGDTGEMVSYYTMPQYSAQVHTAAPPATSAIIIPWEKVLPDSTVVNIEGVFTQPLFGETFGSWGSRIDSIQGLEYRITITINGIVIFTGLHNMEISSNQISNDWLAGMQRHLVIVNAAPWSANLLQPQIYSQFTEGFDTDCVNSYSGSLTHTKTAFAAPEHCNRVVPEIFLTTGGDKDGFGGHEITFHVDEDIKNFAPPATFVHQAYDSKLAMKQPIFIFRGYGDASSYFEMPPGLSMSATGRMTGTPTTTGTWRLEINFIDAEGFLRCAVPLTIIVKVRNPEFFYPDDFDPSGNNDQAVNWYMEEGDSGTIESSLSFGTTPYNITKSGDDIDGASFDSATGDWTLNPAYTQVADTSGTITMSVVDDTNKTDSVTFTWFRQGAGGGGI